MEKSAKNLVLNIIPSVTWSEEEQRQAHVAGLHTLFAVGLTGVHDMSGADMITVNRRKALYEAGKLKIRIYNTLSAETARELGAPQIGLYDNRYTLRAIKTVADGAMSPRSAALFEDYSDMPGWKGVMIIDKDAFTRDTVEFLKLGFTMRTHTIGDLAIRMVLDVYEEAIALTGIKNARLGMEHNHLPHPDDIARFAELGIFVNSTPNWATGAETFVARFGPERARFGYPFKTWLDMGVVVGFGTDYSVSPYYPWPNIEHAITRITGTEPGPGWQPAQRLTREEALRGYTINCAWGSFEEDIKGSIETGKLADFVVIDRDYMTIPVTEIGNIEALKTVLGGEVVYTAEGS